MFRCFLLLSMFCVTDVFSQKAYNVLDWKAEYTLNTFLLQKMHTQYDQRRIAFEKALVSPGATEKYINDTRDGLRAKIKLLFNTLPADAPLNAKITGVIKRDGYRIEKLVYESFAQHHVTANLYIPEGKGPFPAALLFCGHEDLAKATASYQQTAILFAKNGFVVLVIDPVSQSERYQLTGANAKPLTRGGTTEHTLLNAASNLVGTSTPAYEFWDNKRGLDYLLTRKEVDAEKIGCLGNSGGGIKAIYFAALDKRIKVVAPCSYLATRERTLELSGAADGCAQIPNEGKLQLEMSDFLVAAAPRPILVMAGRYDFIDYTGTKEAFSDLKKIYTSLHQPGKVSLFTIDDGHGISKPKREAAVSFFRKWLYNDPTPVKEPELDLLDDKELFATTAGQVNAEYADEMSIPLKNRGLYDSLLTNRHATQYRADGKLMITMLAKGMLGMAVKQASVSAQMAGTVKGNNTDFQKLVIRKEEEPPLPALLYRPDGTPSKIVIWLSATGKAKPADSLGLINSYKTQNAALLLADLRGIGETEDKAEFNDPKYYNKEYRNAMLALHIGSPLPGQRTTDILTLVQFIKNDPSLASVPIEIHAQGIAALPALHAVLFEPAIGEVFLYDAIKSFKALLDDPLRKDMYSYVIPGVLQYYDLPDLVQYIGPAKVHYVDTGNSTGKR